MIKNMIRSLFIRDNKIYWKYCTKHKIFSLGYNFELCLKILYSIERNGRKILLWFMRLSFRKILKKNSHFWAFMLQQFVSLKAFYDIWYLCVLTHTHATYSINLYPYSIVNSINFHLRHSFHRNCPNFWHQAHKKKKQFEIKKVQWLLKLIVPYFKTRKKRKLKNLLKMSKSHTFHTACRSENVNLNSKQASEYWIQNVGEKFWKIIKLKAWTFLTA